ncbi:hypothetical protein DM02DRAFT_525011 [Periconia macrospinosa]|uniref:FAD linked oxidase N-terminal domain-containing protein n=1 Tax=Periconia macrospinosa TaxID=97972 RepID=A0A2V1DT89_9PLEO|nr:hypothetical protein DM02DRAFT_525011 [Periconia macrospinosa]
MSLSSLISFFVILFHVNASLAYTERCKSVSGTLDWPSEAEWNLLNRTISGALLNPQPPAQSCYITPPTSFSEAKCNLTTESWSDSSFIADDPVSVAYPNWQDDACIPPSLAIGKGNCSISLFPKYVVNATTSLHVAATLKYAVEKEIRVVVKGGAHDLLGRYES